MKFKLSIMDADKRIFDGDVETVFAPGTEGEYELLAYHYPILSLLRRGKIIIDWEYYIPVKRGIVKFFKNDCVALIEIDE